MEELKDLFGENGIKYDDFIQKVNEKGIKLADLSKGEYVSKKKYDDDLATANNSSADWQTKYNDLNNSIKSNDDTFQKKYDNLMYDYNNLKSETEKLDNSNKEYKRKEIVRENGINNDRLINLALFELKDSQDFEKDIKDWAKNNKSLLGGSKSFKMNGNPNTDDENNDPFLKSFYKSAGVDEKDLEKVKE